MLWHCIRAAGAKFLSIPSETTFRKVSKRGQNGQKSSQYTAKMLDPYGKSWQISCSYGKSLAETPPIMARVTKNLSHHAFFCHKPYDFYIPKHDSTLI